jgi:predicted nuclease of predicted toxin-antitoxin system
MQLEWEIWLDHHFSPIIAKWLGETKGWVVKSSYTLSTASSTDFELYQKAREYGNVIIISKDSDLPELVTKLGSPPKVINVKTGNTRNRIMYHILVTNIDNAVKMLIDFNKDIIELD